MHRIYTLGKIVNTTSYYLLTVLSALALNPDESSWKQQSSTAPPCMNSPLKALALASYKRTV